MLIRTYVLFLISLFLSTSMGSQITFSQTPNDADIEKIRTKVRGIGVGAQARVEVKLRNDKKLKGHIASATNDAFTVVEPKTGVTQTIEFGDVASVKKPNKGLGRTTWIVIGAAAAAAIIVSVTVLHPVLCDGGAGC